MQYFDSYNEQYFDVLFDQINETNFDLASFLKHITNTVKESKNQAHVVAKILNKTLHVKKQLLSIVVAGLMVVAPLNKIVSNSTEIDNKELILNLIKKRKEQIEFQRISKIDPSFYDIISNVESRNNWMLYNDYKGYYYIGKYQIGMLSLLDTYHKYKPKYLKVSQGDTIKQKIRKMIQDFITVCKDSTLDAQTKHEKLNRIFPEHEQEIVMKNIVKNNEHYLRKYKDFIGRDINGIKITWSGLIAAAHLVGARSVKEYLDSNGTTVPKDGTGTSIETYIKMFK